MSDSVVYLAVSLARSPQSLTAVRSALATTLAGLRQSEDALECQIRDLRRYRADSAARPGAR